MKKHALIILCLQISLMNAQVVLQENFTKPFTPVSKGWVVKNLSQSPQHNNTWVQGFSNWFTAFNGGPDDYFSSSFFATNSSTPATISAWLLTPTVTLVNGAVFEFVSRTVSNPAQFPDRLEVYLSTAGTGTDIGLSHTSVGTFSTMIITINPSLTTTDYPDTWTLFSATITGLSAQETGRFGFRYHVINGGGSQQAVNSEFVGIDAVKYTLPCNATISSYTTCAGQTVTLTANGAAAGTSFTWSPGITNSSIVVSPSVTTSYTLNYEVSDLICPALTSTITIGQQLNIHVSASSSSFCEGGMATLTATGAAASYTWLNANSHDPVITVTPAVTTIYSVTGSAGTSPGNICAGSSTLLITVHPNPVLNVSLTRFNACVNETVGVSVTGADSYTWTGVFNATVTSFVYKTGLSTGGKTFFVAGSSDKGCTSSASAMVKVNLCTDLAEQSVQGDHFYAYPNPTTDGLKIRSAPGVVSMFNMLGEKIWETQSAGELQVDVSIYPAGGYFIRWQSPEHPKGVMLKVVKIN